MPSVRSSSAVALGKVLAIALAAPPSRHPTPQKKITTVWTLEIASNHLAQAFVKSKLYSYPSKEGE